jgi:regulator of extracellular matrix RemA (YlzA/DUF370 family)
MLLHLGGDWAANSNRVIAILDYSTVCGVRSCKRMLADAQARGALSRIDDTETRSMILLSSPGGCRVVLSPISATALKGRLQSNAVYLDFPVSSRRKSSRKGK